MDGLNKDPARGAAAEGLVQAPKTDEGVDSTKQSSAVPPTPPIQGDGGGEGNEEAPLPKENPFDQYYSQLTHQQNMLQDSVRVTAYQRAILENAADFKVRLPPQPPQCPGQEHLPVRFGVDVERLYIVQRGLPLASVQLRQVPPLLLLLVLVTDTANIFPFHPRTRIAMYILKPPASMADLYFLKWIV